MAEGGLKRAGAGLRQPQLDCSPAFGGAGGDQGFVALLLAMTGKGAAPKR
jgi:hypothetical protein